MRRRTGSRCRGSRDPRRLEARRDAPGFTADARSRASGHYGVIDCAVDGRRPVEVARRVADTIRMSLDRPAAARPPSAARPHRPRTTTSTSPSIH
jgi:hypothetical protein